MNTDTKKDENSKSRILEAATKLFAQKGFDGASIREICKLADVNLCMISYYWGGKQELYNGIIEDLIEKQIEYSKSFLDLNRNPQNMSTKECVDLLITISDRLVNFFYTNVSSDLIVILLKEQQKLDFIVKSPVLDYMRSVVARILNKDVNDRLVIFKTLFMLSQVNSPRILPAFSLRPLGQTDFCEEDIKIIKENVKLYINAILKEGGRVKMIKKFLLVFSLLFMAQSCFAVDVQELNIDFFTRFNDEYLNCYIQEALNNNHELKKAGHVVEQYRQQTKYSLGRELPSLSVSANYLGVKVPELDNFQLKDNAFILPFIASYEADFLLKNRDKTKAIKKSYEASKFNEKAVYLALLSDVATVYTNILQYDDLIEKQSKILQNQEEILNKSNKKI